MVSTLIEAALSDALKSLMQSKPIHQIAVKEITDACGLTRHTFYNHFHDIYELLAWTYDCEVVIGAEKLATTENWEQSVDLVLNYTWENRKLCLNTFHSLGRDHLETFLYKTFYTIVNSAVEDATRGREIPNLAKENCKEFYTNALIGNFTAWLKSDLKESPEQFAKKINPLIRSSFSHVLMDLCEKADTK